MSKLVNVQWNNGELKDFVKAVKDYAECYVLRNTILKKYAEKIEALRALIKGLENCEGSAIPSEKLQAQAEEYAQAITDLEESRDLELKKMDKWQRPKNLAGLQKRINGLSYDATIGDIGVILVEFFMNEYGLVIDGSNDLEAIKGAIGKSNDVRTMAMTGKAMQRYKGATVVNSMIKELYAIFVGKGIIRECDIPEALKGYYTKKENAKKAKKKAE